MNRNFTQYYWIIVTSISSFCIVAGLLILIFYPILLDKNAEEVLKNYFALIFTGLFAIIIVQIWDFLFSKAEFKRTLKEKEDLGYFFMSLGICTWTIIALIRIVILWRVGELSQPVNDMMSSILSSFNNLFFLLMVGYLDFEEKENLPFILRLKWIKAILQKRNLYLITTIILGFTLFLFFLGLGDSQNFWLSYISIPDIIYSIFMLVVLGFSIIELINLRLIKRINWFVAIAFIVAIIAQILRLEIIEYNSSIRLLLSQTFISWLIPILLVVVISWIYRIENNELRKEKDYQARLRYESTHRVYNVFKKAIAQIEARANEEDISENKQIYDILKEVNSRLRLMARIHELLTEDVSKRFQENNKDLNHSLKLISLEKLMNELIKLIGETLTSTIQLEKNIKINIKERIHLEHCQAIGLLIFEAVINAEKYGAAVIELDIEANNDFFVIKVEDDGIGFDVANPDFDKFGMKFIKEVAKNRLKAVPPFWFKSEKYQTGTMVKVDFLTKNIMNKEHETI